jgi:polyisoprenoid-binding protein YceI
MQCTVRRRRWTSDVRTPGEITVMFQRSSAIARLCLCLLLFAPAPALAQGVRGSARISFSATSTLHDFQGSAGSAMVALSQAADGTWSADVSVPVAAIETGNRRRDGDMRRMFDAPRHPQIRARFRGVDAEAVRSSGVLPFLLRIRTVERPVKAVVRNWRQSEREASFDASFDVSLESFQLEAPSAFFLTVDDTVHVSVHVRLEREQP